MPPFEAPREPSNVIKFPFPEKATDFKAVHKEELDKKYGATIDLFKRSHVTKLSSFNFETLREKIVVQGSISEEVFEAYLTVHGLTWDENAVPHHGEVKYN